MSEIIEPKLVIIESPFRGEDYDQTERNILYAKLCVSDSLKRGEAPFASHLFYTQRGILDDTIEEERDLGIAAGVAWGSNAKLTAVYHDFDISGGMKYGIKAAEEIGRAIDYRKLAGVIDLEVEIEKLAKECSSLRTNFLF